jgi:hypothetical protein
MELRELGVDGANWIRLAQDRFRWRPLVRTLMNLRFHKEREYILARVTQWKVNTEQPREL